MNVTTCEKKDAKTAELTVVVAPEEFDKALNEAYRKNKGQIAVPGFRKGKAPRKIIESMYGASVFYNDALDIILPTVCSHGVSESKLQTVGYPKIDDVNIEDDKSVTIKYTVELYPEVTLGQYKGLSAVKPAAVVEESNIDSEIASVQLRNARIQTATRPAINGDTAVIDFEGFVDGVAFEGGKGEDYELVLGSNTFIPGFEAKINGMTVGEERDLDLVFPKEYKEDLAGKPVVFKVKLKEVKEKILPELDDEFAKDVSEFDTLQEYRDSIREKLTAAKAEEAEKAFEDAVMNKLADSIECDVPEAMIEEFLNNQLENFRRQLTAYGMELDMYLNMMGTNVEGFKTNMRPNAITQIKISLALDKIAETEKLEPTDEEIEAYYTDMSTKYGVEINVAKESIPVESVKHELNIKAASKLVTDNAIATEATSAEATSEEATSAEAVEAVEEAETEPAVKEKKTRKAKTEVSEELSENEAAESDSVASDTVAQKKPASKKTPAKKAAKTDSET